MFNAFNRNGHVTFEVNEITWFCDVTCDIRLHSFSDVSALLYISSTRATTASGGADSLPEYKVNCNDFESLATSYKQNHLRIRFFCRSLATPVVFGFDIRSKSNQISYI